MAEAGARVVAMRVSRHWLQCIGCGLLCLLWCVTGTAAAQSDSDLAAQPQTPLQADELLQRSAEHVPQILAASADRQARLGLIQQADGAFDTTVSADSYSRLSGFYDGQLATAKISQPLAEYSAEVYGSYRISRGSFPVYEDINFTNLGGELKLGVALSLLRDRDLDRRRFQRNDARLALDVADYALQAVFLDVQRNALKAYNEWQAFGLQRQVFDNLLQLAFEREKALRIRIDEGDAAEILLTENRQNIIRRQSLLVEAERDLQRAAIALSYYYRDQNGQPLRPPPQRLPPAASYFTLEQDLPVLDDALQQALQQRPEPARLNTEIQRARQRILLAENDIKPNLDLRYELARDLGDPGQGGLSREGVDNIVSLNFSVPLQRNAATGRRVQAQAEMEALAHRRQNIEDSIAVELERVFQTLQAAAELRQLAELEIEQAIAMRDAEQELFRSGASNFFLVNQREIVVADARNRRIAAVLQYRQALADLAVITADFDSLQIELLSAAERNTLPDLGR